MQSVKRYLAAGPRAAVFLGDRHRQGSAAILQARPKRFGAAPPFCVLVLGPRGKGKIVSAQAARPRPSKLLGDVVDGACRGCDAFEKRDNAPSHGRVGLGAGGGVVSRNNIYVRQYTRTFCRCFQQLKAAMLQRYVRNILLLCVNFPFLRAGNLWQEHAIAERGKLKLHK